MPDRVQEGADHVGLLDELQQRVVAEDHRAELAGEVARQGGPELGAQHIGEAQDRDRHLGTVVREVPDERLGLEQRALDRRPGRGAAGHGLGEGVGIARAGPVDEARRLHHERSDPAGRARRGQQVHRPDDVHVVESGRRAERRVDDQARVHDRVDVGCRHDPVKRRVGVVRDPHEVGPLEGHRRVPGADPDHHLDLRVGLEHLGHPTAPEGVGPGDQDAGGDRSAEPDTPALRDEGVDRLLQVGPDLLGGLHDLGEHE